MLLPYHNIFISVSEDTDPERIRHLSGELAQKLEFIKSHKIIEYEFISQVVNSYALWVMDYNTYDLILQKNSQSVLDSLPEVLLLANEASHDFLCQRELSDNISLLPFPCSEAVFQISIKQAQKRLNRNWKKDIELHQFKAMFLNSSQVKLLINPSSGNIIEANPAAEFLFNLPPDSLRGTSIESIHPESKELFFGQIQDAMQGEKTYLNLKYSKNEEDSRELEYLFNAIEIAGEKLILANIEDVTEKEIASELFYQQAEMLRNTLESIDDLMFSLNRDGDFLEYYQPTGGSHLALSSDVFIGRNIHDVGFPLDVSRTYLNNIEIVIEEDKPRQIDYYLEAFGSRLWYNARISPRKNAFGVVEGVTVLCRDVTKQKKSEEALKKARDFYLTLLNDFPSLVWKTNTTRRADYFNKTWLEFTGNSLETEIRTDWMEKLPVADANTLSSVLINAYKNKQSFQIEHRLKHHSGEYRWVINAGRPFYNLEGQFSGFIGSCYDISERKKAEEMLHLQKSAMESALEGILIIEDDDKNYPVIYANKELTRLTDFSEKQIIGNAFLEVLGCPLTTEVRNHILAALKNKTSFKGEFFCIDNNNSNSRQWRLLYMAPVKDKKEKANHFVAVLSDITETKEVEKTLRERNKLLRKTNQELDNFVYSTSHELRSPLMSVLGLLNLMESDISKEEMNTFLAMIRESISRLDKIIHDIIDYSRNSRMEVVYEKIEFNELVDKVIQNHQYVDNFNKVKFIIEVQDGTPFLSDTKRIQIVINNFVSNCLRFHNYQQESPFIRISIKTSPVNVSISIADNGKGIDDKHHSRIYDMFYRGTTESKGSGIGLYIVKEIVDKLKGNIEVKSESGQGTTFIVDLPNFVNKNYKIMPLSEAESNNSYL